MRIFLTLILFVLCAVQSLSFAESVHVVAVSEFEPTSTIGLIITPGETFQITETKVRRLEEGKYDIEFAVPETNKGVDTLVSAILFSSDGTIAFAPTKDLNSRLPSELPTCTTEKLTIDADEGQIGLLQSLVALRTARRTNAQDRLNKALTGPFLEKLKKLERGFGITYPQPLSATRPPTELIDRLTRIVNAVKNFQQVRKPSADLAPQQ